MAGPWDNMTKRMIKANPELLQSLNLKLLAAQDLDEVKKILFEAGKQ